MSKRAPPLTRLAGSCNNNNNNTLTTPAPSVSAHTLQESAYASSTTAPTTTESTTAQQTTTVPTCLSVCSPPHVGSDVISDTQTHPRQFQDTTEFNHSVNRLTPEHVVVTHGVTKQQPFEVKVVAFNRDPKTNRIKFSLRVRFEHQSWMIFKHYSDFLALRDNLDKSQFSALASNLPPKHPLTLRLRMKMSLSRRRALRREVGFIRHRMIKLESWLNAILVEAGPSGVQHVDFINEFFEAFPDDDEPYHRATPRRVHGQVHCSMYHTLRPMAVPTGLYLALWNAGHCFDTLRTMSVNDWRTFGTSLVLAATLHATFHRVGDVVSLSTTGQQTRRSGSSVVARARAASLAAQRQHEMRHRALSDAAVGRHTVTTRECTGHDISSTTMSNNVDAGNDHAGHAPPPPYQV
eukprot:m.107544 g.107544  ORF g.107544 m.107544 type:complete len:407 (-) comp10625_c0_seq1:169-1389(-)